MNTKSSGSLWLESLAHYQRNMQYDTTRGLIINSPAKSETGKTEFTVAGILRDADIIQPKATDRVGYYVRIEGFLLLLTQRKNDRGLYCSGRDTARSTASSRERRLNAQFESTTNKGRVFIN